MSFKAFLRDYPKDSVPECDFVNDALEDESMPDAKTWEELEDYLALFASDGAIRSARIVWDRYAERT